MIRLQNVSKSYGQINVLHNVNFHLPRGEFAFLKGRSGSGKSTFLKALYREVDIDSGSIFIDGKNHKDMKKFELRREIGIIFQSFELIEQKTVFENVALAGKVLGRPMKEIEAEAMRLLERVGLKNKRDVYPAQLSGGQQQRVAIVRALLNKPALLLADEPTGNLDEQTSDEIMQLLYELHKEEHISMLIVTHAEKFLTAQSKIWVMEEGHIHEHTSSQVHA